MENKEEEKKEKACMQVKEHFLPSIGHPLQTNW